MPMNITDLMDVEAEKRDQVWERAFLKALPTMPVSVLSPEPKEGPDHWPYLMVSSDGMVGKEPDDTVRNVTEWLANKGIGMCVNPMKDDPDYVLSYGMIWNYRERGEFMTEAPPSEAGRIDLTPGQKLWTGAPSETYLPLYVRGIIKQFLADQGVFSPKVLLVNFKANESTSEKDAEALSGFDLCFSIESFKSPPQHEHANIAEALSWFLPAHYSVTMVSEKSLPGFKAL